MGVGEGVVELDEGVGGEELLDIPEGVEDGLELADDVGDVEVEVEVAL